MEKAANEIYNVSEGFRTNLADYGDDLVFSIDVDILDFRIVKNSDGEVIPFEKLNNDDYYGRVLISIELFYKMGSDILTNIKVKEIVLKT